MKRRLEITTKPNIDLKDSTAVGFRDKANKYFDFNVQVRSIDVITFKLESLDKRMLEEARKEIFTDPITQISSFDPITNQLNFDWDYAIWVGPKPGLMDPAGKTAEEAIEQYFELELDEEEKIFTSDLYLYKGDLSRKDVEKLAKELHANPNVNQFEIFDRQNWDPEKGIGIPLPEVKTNESNVETFPIDEQKILELSKERGLYLNPEDIPTIVDYFSRPEVQKERQKYGLLEPTDVELEYIAQTVSDHCRHRTFNGKFYYKNKETKEEFIIDNLFEETIEKPTRSLAEKHDWIKSVLWDNAGVIQFDKDHCISISAETHNSPSNMDPYGGAVTGNVGEFRDKLGTGIGSRVFLGLYGYCVAPTDYGGTLKPHIHPRRLLDGVIEGVRDGGNKMGVPTPYGNILFDESYLGKCLVYVGSAGIMPSEINGEPTYEKKINDGDLCVIVGGRVGRDGIHGVTASSAEYSEETPVSHVQHGFPYLEKKVEGLLLEARDKDLLNFTWDLGGGGNSSAIGETASFTNKHVGSEGGVEIELSNDLLKYRPMDPWEIWVSESQERMLAVIDPGDREKFMELSEKWGVESRVLGKYKDNGVIHVEHNGDTVLHMDLDFIDQDFPQWEFEAEWIPPENRLSEPVIEDPKDHEKLLKNMISRPNICGKAWVRRQYDHEVQGGSVIKPLVGQGEVKTDAVVSKPVLDSNKGFAVTQVINPWFSEIDTYNMTSYVIDEGVRRIIAVGGELNRIGGLDNYCWPTIQYDPEKNPDGKYKAAQLVRSCLALKEVCQDYEIPLLSGKDSMYIDGKLKGEYGETQRVSGKPSLQFTTCSIVNDVEKCVTMDPKFEGDLVYVIGKTKDELGGSEYYDLLGYVGLNVPEVNTQEFYPVYESVQKTIQNELVASAHAVSRGGLGIGFAKMAIAGQKGLNIDLSKLSTYLDQYDKILYSESAGRFIVTVDPDKKEEFEDVMKDHPCFLVGKVTNTNNLKISDGQKKVLEVSIKDLDEKYREKFGDRI